MPPSPRLEVDPTSLRGAAAILYQAAHDLHRGQFNVFLLDLATPPCSHPEFDAALRTFGEFANDQYQDAVALLAALSTGVDASAGGYQEADTESAQDIASLITDSGYVPADQRPR
jgi:hypothetical protein